MPTGSLKDRSNSVGLSVAREWGFKTSAVMSTGNAAASVAAYSAAAGINSVVMVPAGTAPSKIIQAGAYGATVVVIDGSFDYEVAKLYKAAVQEFGTIAFLRIPIATKERNPTRTKWWISLTVKLPIG